MTRPVTPVPTASKSNVITPFISSVLSDITGGVTAVLDVFSETSKVIAVDNMSKADCCICILGNPQLEAVATVAYTSVSVKQ